MTDALVGVALAAGVGHAGGWTGLLGSEDRRTWWPPWQSAHEAATEPLRRRASRWALVRYSRSTPSWQLPQPKSSLSLASRTECERWHDRQFIRPAASSGSCTEPANVARVSAWQVEHAVSTPLSRCGRWVPWTSWHEAHEILPSMVSLVPFVVPCRSATIEPLWHDSHSLFTAPVEGGRALLWVGWQLVQPGLARPFAAASAWTPPS